jgi:Mn2+/Fe2+ NRAMP family transporter
VAPEPIAKLGLRRGLKQLGPGLITGAADDDPSGIATYSQAGAQFGFSMLWTVVFTLPPMVAIQLVSACIGYVTRRGLAANIKIRFPRWVPLAVVGMLLSANTLNVAADIAAMAEALRLLLGGSAHGYAVTFGLLCLLLPVFLPYRSYPPHTPQEVRRHLRRIRTDTVLGMAFSNLIAFFVILSTAATLHAAGVTDIQTSAQAAEALRPLAGEFTFLLFSLGIIGTGLLAVPVLAGAAGYAVAEAAGWQGTLSSRPDRGEGRGFYAVIAAATPGGVILCFTPTDPVRWLGWAATLTMALTVAALLATL